MRIRPSMLLFAVVLFAAACGGGGRSDDDDDDDPIDAAIDAPGGGALSGLGQVCGGAGGAACPANAPTCLVRAQGMPGFCAPDCVTNGMGTTNAQAQFPQSGAGAITPAANPGACTAAYSGGAMGMPACGVIYQLTPADAQLQPNKAYTGINIACIVACVANACPPGSGLTCQSGICAP
jgi:hypothetical protein